MKATFLGVGSAFDEEHNNISMVLEAAGKNILLDCGYAVPHALFTYEDDPDFLDAIWISHPHADHYFGLGMLIRLKSDERTKPLVILTRPEIREKIEQVIELSYPGSYDEMPFEITYHEFEEETMWEGINFSIAPTEHPVPNKALRVEAEGKVFCYSGDGMFTPQSKELFRDCDLLVHETFTITEKVENHGNIKDVADMAREVGVKNLAVVHLRNDVRKDLKSVKEFLNEKDEETLLPVEGDVLEV